MENEAKILISGLDYAGKTSIMLALNEQKGYIDKVMNLKPTIKIKQIKIDFLGRKIVFWDLGGQEKYRRQYYEKREFYYPETDVLFHIVDIQDETRFNTSLEYLDTILNFFKKNKEFIPVIVSFHKSDPDIIDDPEIQERVDRLTQEIQGKYSEFELLFQQTSIFDIVSIIKMISYGLAVLNEDFFQLYELLEEYSCKLDSFGIFLLNHEGMIICKFFKDPIDENVYAKLSDSVKEHIFELRDNREKNLTTERKLFELGDGFRSYLHPINYRNEDYFMSILLNAKPTE